MTEAVAELAVVERNGFPESRHYGSLVALGADGAVELALGVPEAAVLPRSSTKPWQAVACIEAGANLTGAHAAIAAGSHTGEPDHVRAVGDILAAAGMSPADLGCPPDWPENEAARNDRIRAGGDRARITMNCSGKHAAMLAACAVNGWDSAGYLGPHHPLQRKIRTTIEAATGQRCTAVAVDGCGAPLFAATVLGLARAGHRLVTAPPATAHRTVADAMSAHPFYVGGTGHPNTVFMQRLAGSICKGGAEGVLVAAVATGQAVAMKIIDGSPRATTMLALAALRAIGVDTAAAGDLDHVDVLGGGRPVGAVHPSGEFAAVLAARS